ncbi:hypothetical protein BDF14DRAFT_1760436 [Spinellus fusiger]|nr:hypothetical protein BDF14DRAFT_1760436 [Spinellus fusiger]
MEDVLTQADDPNIVLETITSRENYLNAKRPGETSDESSAKRLPKSSNLSPPVKSYRDYSDFTRDTFIDRMLESPQEHELHTRRFLGYIKKYSENKVAILL